MSKSKKCFVDEDQKREIIYNLINAGLAGGLVFLGSLTNDVVAHPVNPSSKSITNIFFMIRTGTTLMVY